MFCLSIIGRVALFLSLVPHRFTQILQLIKPSLVVFYGFATIGVAKRIDDQLKFKLMIASSGQ